jgi:hypothetical protein
MGDKTNACHMKRLLGRPKGKCRAIKTNRKEIG